MDWDREKEKKAGKAYHVGVSVFALIFAIIWCLAAVAMGAGFMLIFGINFNLFYLLIIKWSIYTLFVHIN